MEQEPIKQSNQTPLPPTGQSPSPFALPQQPASQSVSTPQPPTMNTGNEDSTNGGTTMVIRIVVGIIVVVAVAALGYLVYRKFNDQSVQQQSEQIANTQQPLNQGAIAPEQRQDSDGDGLTDAEESQAGTDPKKADTDADGLSDRLEVRVYKSDPRDADSDNDNFSDGEEVRNFYNPNGDGRLIDTKKAIDEFQGQ